METTKADYYKEKRLQVTYIWNLELRYGSLVFWALILTLAIYLIKIKRFQRFEWTIVVCMLLKYITYAINTSFSAH